ncbi:ammonia transport outward protein 2 [[Candida] anglica]|uniref:Ammonia transport outward protein 2 n=1 Tax=[Candida] anglica TaxID=148631 RepID=A0ABP0EJ97_9ASCO
MSSGSQSIIDKVSAEHSVASIQHDGEFIILGGKKYYKNELQTAFGGTLTAERYAPYPKHQFANAAAMGLSSFAMTTFVLGLYYAGAMGIKIPNMVIGLTFFYGGIVQFLAGVWELAIGNVFAGTALASYGPFWFAFGSIYVESFGIQAAYKDEPEQMANAVGFFLVGWSIFTFLLVLCCLKSTVMFLGLFLTLDLTFILLAAGNFTGNPKIVKAGGIMAVISACCGWYNAFAGTATKQNSYFNANPIPLPVWGKI